MIFDNYEIRQAAKSLSIRAFCENGNLFGGGPLRLFDLELTSTL